MSTLPCTYTFLLNCSVNSLKSGFSQITNINQLLGFLQIFLFKTLILRCSLYLHVMAPPHSYWTYTDKHRPMAGWTHYITSRHIYSAFCQALAVPPCPALCARCVFLSPSVCVFVCLSSAGCGHLFPPAASSPEPMWYFVSAHFALGTMIFFFSILSSPEVIPVLYLLVLGNPEPFIIWFFCHKSANSLSLTTPVCNCQPSTTARPAQLLWTAHFEIIELSNKVFVRSSIILLFGLTPPIMTILAKISVFNHVFEVSRGRQRQNPHTFTLLRIYPHTQNSCLWIMKKTESQ